MVVLGGGLSATPLGNFAAVLIFIDFEGDNNVIKKN
jgi:hypothetical protein